MCSFEYPQGNLDITAEEAVDGYRREQTKFRASCRISTRSIDKTTRSIVLRKPPTSSPENIFLTATPPVISFPSVRKIRSESLSVARTRQKNRVRFLTVPVYPYDDDVRRRHVHTYIPLLVTNPQLPDYTAYGSFA